MQCLGIWCTFIVINLPFKLFFPPFYFFSFFFTTASPESTFSLLFQHLFMNALHTAPDHHISSSSRKGLTIYLQNNTMWHSYKYHHILSNKKCNQNPLSLSFITPQSHFIHASGPCLREVLLWCEVARLCADFRLLDKSGPVLECCFSSKSTAAASQVFGCVWLHHLVLIAASSKNWQDFQQTPSFL